MRGEFPEHFVLSREWRLLAGLPSERFDGLLVCSGSWMAVVSQSSKTRFYNNNFY